MEGTFHHKTVKFLARISLLRRCCPCACPSSSAVGSSKRVTISFSRYYLFTRPLIGAINCLQSWHRHCSSSSSWHPRRRSVASSREVERRRTGQIWLAYQLPMCAAILLHPSLPKNNSETSENWKRLSYNTPPQARRWTVVRSGWPSNAVRVAIFYGRCHRQPSMRNWSILSLRRPFSTLLRKSQNKMQMGLRFKK